MIFYGKDGVPITLERFITLYGDSYYLDKERYVPGVSQSSRYTEDEIDRLLREGIKCELDVIHILAWIIGKIRHAESKSRFCYYKDWSNAESFRANRYGKEFDLKTISQYNNPSLRPFHVDYHRKWPLQENTCFLNRNIGNENGPNDTAFAPN